MATSRVRGGLGLPASDVTVVDTTPTGHRVLVLDVVAGERDATYIETFMKGWVQAAHVGHACRFPTATHATLFVTLVPHYAKHWLIDQIKRVRDAEHRGVLVNAPLVEQMELVRKHLNRRFPGFEHEVQNTIRSMDSLWGIPTQTCRDPHRQRGAVRGRGQRERRPGHRRTTSTSRAGPDDPGEGEPGRPNRRWAVYAYAALAPEALGLRPDEFDVVA